MLQQKHSSPIRLDRVDNIAAINDIQSNSSLSKRELFANTFGKMGYFQAAGIDANAAKSALQSNIARDQQNLQVGNEETRINDSKFTDDQMFNLKNIRSTFDNNTKAGQYRSEQLANGFTESLNNGLAVNNNLETLGQNATTMAMPYLGLKGVTANGEIVDAKDPKAVRTIQTTPIGFNRNRRSVSTWLGSLNSMAVSQSGNKVDSYQEYANAITEFAKSTGISDPFKAAQALGFFKQLMVKQGFNKTEQ